MREEHLKVISKVPVEICSGLYLMYQAARIRRVTRRQALLHSDESSAMICLSS